LFGLSNNYVEHLNWMLTLFAALSSMCVLERST